MAEIEDLLAFFETAGKLKSIKRQGWIDRGLKDVESVAGHSHRLSLMALVFAKKLGLDQARAVKMALVHDLPECITGDISADKIFESYRHGYDNTLGMKPDISSLDKRKMEKAALEKLLGFLDRESAKEIFGLWSEFEEKKTETAMLVKQLDRLDVMLQALEYKKQHPENPGLSDFFSFQEKNFGKNEAYFTEIFEKIAAEFRALEKGK